VKASDVAEVLDKLAPPSLAYKGEELGFIVGDGDKQIKAVGVTERPTVDVLQEAVDERTDMLVVHEPLYQSKKAFLVDSSDLSYLPNKKREELVSKGGFCVFRYHSQWDDAKEGNNEVLASLFGLEVIDKLPYGRIGEVSTKTLKQFANEVKKTLGSDGVLVVGDMSQSIKKVAVVAGSGNSLTEIMEVAKKKGADVLVSGDIHDSKARFARELGLPVIDAGDYHTENPGAKRLAELLQKRLPKIKVFHLDPGPPWEVV